jgi:mannose-6-phosphate isomerase-like protein (cupin superfamily)
LSFHFKRVVVVMDEGGSVVQEDAPVDPITSDLMPGTEIYAIWGTEGPVPRHSEKGIEAVTAPYFPGPGGTRCGAFTFPPEKRDAAVPEPPDPETLERLAADLETKLPGLLGIFEPEDPGFHQTPTVDYVFVIQGTMTLELDDGSETELPPGSCVVQNGTRHAWRNYGEETAILAHVIVAAAGPGEG